MSESDCAAKLEASPELQAARAAAAGAGVDPDGVPFTELTPEQLRQERTSIKWGRFASDVLPLFVAEMDFAVASEVRNALIARIAASDTGYLHTVAPLADAFAGFAADRWGWEVRPERVHLATDVATGVVEALRVGRPAGGRLALATPTYPGFFEMLEEVPFEVVELPLSLEGPDRAPAARLDLAAIERAFASPAGIDAFILCNPHNPHGLVHSAADLTRLAELAAQYDVFIVSDEIHAPLTHSGVTFTPFAPIAAAAGALSVTATSASKGWNIAGTKCSVIIAADDRANEVLTQLPPEVATRASILGLHASVAAFTEGRDWLDRAIAQVEANERLLAALIAEKLPAVGYTRPSAGYLAWLDFSGAGLGANPYARLLDEARVALNDGAAFGTGGAQHVRFNLACPPATVEAAIDRVAALVNGAAGAAGDPAQDTAPVSTEQAAQ